VGRTPSIITTPAAYDALPPWSLGFPQVIYTGTVRSCPHGPSNAVVASREDKPALGSRLPRPPAQTGAAASGKCRHGYLSPRGFFFPPYRASGGLDAHCSLEPIFNHWPSRRFITAVFFVSWHTGPSVSGLLTQPCPPAVCTDLLQQSEEEVRRTSDSDSKALTSLARMTLRQNFRRRRQWPWCPVNNSRNLKQSSPEEIQSAMQTAATLLRLPRVLQSSCQPGRTEADFPRTPTRCPDKVVFPAQGKSSGPTYSGDRRRESSPGRCPAEQPALSAGRRTSPALSGRPPPTPTPCRRWPVDSPCTECTSLSR